MNNNLRQDDLGEFLCSDCGIGLDDDSPTLVPEHGQIIALCSRCLRLRRARLAAASGWS